MQPKCDTRCPSSPTGIHSFRRHGRGPDPAHPPAAGEREVEYDLHRCDNCLAQRVDLATARLPELSLY